jgi:hypothetical protein
MFTAVQAALITSLQIAGMTKEKTMKKRIAIYSIDKTVSYFRTNEECENDGTIILDESGTLEDFETEEKAIEKIKNIYGISCDFQSWFKEYGDEKGRWFGCQTENENGDADDDGKYLADYNIYLKVYEEVEL